MAPAAAQKTVCGKSLGQFTPSAIKAGAHLRICTILLDTHDDRSVSQGCVCVCPYVWLQSIFVPAACALNLVERECATFQHSP